MHALKITQEAVSVNLKREFQFLLTSEHCYSICKACTHAHAHVLAHEIAYILMYSSKVIKTYKDTCLAYDSCQEGQKECMYSK